MQSSSDAASAACTRPGGSAHVALRPWRAPAEGRRWGGRARARCSVAVLARLRSRFGVPARSYSEARGDLAEYYHLFLSHVWGTGQDQMRIVKQRLLEMMPDMAGHVFLDVDDLEGACNLCHFPTSQGA